ncbi:MAG TPA: ChrR family anti-sigma-E factor [Mesorhizobium sp.]|jgi:putative transcriptional regulator|uniref:ChrR family anti-sigma-E factor n=1 Tax=Mesorhizobium sp. TaxID=1871066 RepID=UPI002DDDA2AC|nr:ChrR family anti-sigma-E factor [Mesorhizobium sp.]HEV2503662.1 ChrR family anti-sigma-E factor [Mesorhizobium sp.]
MTINHHPSDETLLRLAAGTLSAGPALVVAVHLEGCFVCRSRLAKFEAVGGALLDDMPPASLAADLFGRTMERIELDRPQKQRNQVPSKHAQLGLELPRAMRDCEVGPWKWLGPGFKWSKVKIAASQDAKVMLLKGRAGLHLPAHGHTGLEFMQILSGSLSDNRGRYLAGDLDEADSDVDHSPVVGREADCICLAALEGDTRLHGLLGRLLRPIVGF